MKIVHTGDWHIGKTLRGKHRTQEFRGILQELKEFIVEKEVDILLIAGDVFDTFTPSAGAEDIVYNFLYDISRLHVATVVVAGNHDSSLRFEAISNLMSIAGVTMTGYLDAEENKARTITARDGSQAQIVPFPFVPESMFVRATELSEKEFEETAGAYSREMGKIFHRLSQNFTGNTVNIILGHMLMHGATPGGGERRLYLGENYAVHTEEIPENTDYIALGHIHRSQHIPAKSPVHYCGSPIQLDFGEKQTEKGFLFLETRPGEDCIPKFIPLKSGKKLLEVYGNLEEISTLIESNPALLDAHLKITLASETVGTDTAYQLKKNFPNAVEIRRKHSAPHAISIPHGTDWIPDLYEKFYQNQHENNIPSEIIGEFKRLYQRCAVKDPDDS